MDKLTKKQIMEQLQLEMIIAKENGDEELYLQLVDIEAKIKKGQNLNKEPEEH